MPVHSTMARKVTTVSKVTSLAPEAFHRAVEEFRHMQWRGELSIDEIGSPQRIAPYSLAIAGELTLQHAIASAGRLILLHDPAGNASWQGTFRLVSYVRAAVDLEMVADPLLPDVSWSWLTEALETNDCVACLMAGTVTASYGRSFGEMAGEPDTAEVELRSSWTPQLDAEHPLTNHLTAWQELLGLIAGEPPLPPGISVLRTR